MRSFKDNEGRTWTVSVNVAAVKRVRALCGVDLASAITTDATGRVSAELISKLATDPVLLVDVLYALAGDEAQKRGVSDEDFGRAMAGDVIDEAVTVLMDEIVDFFPNPKRALLKKMTDAAGRFGKEMDQALEKALNDPEFDRRIDAEMAKLTGLSSNSPESRE